MTSPFPLFILSILSIAYAEIIQVQVGFAGTFFEPATISAQQNDTVQFIFGGSAHAVTQSTYENPCTPLPGGFSSGIAGIGLNLTQPVQIWNLVVTNVSTPIWFFCDLVQPRSHCNAGMVGVINPPSIPAFQSFYSAAEMVSNTPTPDVTTVILTGKGAFATGAPFAASTSLSSTPTTAPVPIQIISTSSSTATAPTTTAASSNSKKPVGAIIGGTVAGCVAIAVIAVLTFLLFRAKRQRSARSSLVDSSIPPKPDMATPVSHHRVSSEMESVNYHQHSISRHGLISQIPPVIPSASLRPSVINIRSSMRTEDSFYGKYPTSTVYQPRTEESRSPDEFSRRRPVSQPSYRDETTSPVDINSLAKQVAALINNSAHNEPPERRNVQALHGQPQVHPEPWNLRPDLDPIPRILTPGPPSYPGGQ